MNNSDNGDSKSAHHEQVNRLLRLKSINAKAAVALADDAVATSWLAELFKGNGWTVAFHTGARNHRSLLLSDPKRPDTIVMIVKFIINNEALSYEKVKQELVDFENTIGPLYDCTQFSLVTVSGFEAKAERLQDFNLVLQEWIFVEELIDNYSKDKVQEPRIQLFAHNKQTYNKVRRMMNHANGIAVVQATGTGKSYLIAKLLQDFTGEKRLVMAPSYYIIDQIKEHIRWEADLPGGANKIEFMTYARSMNFLPYEIAELKPKMIVLDEFHRCGAEEWGRGVQNILSAYPKAFKFGTSATPVRYLDNGRDMSIELFQGHVAENLSLAQAIARNILPMPKYVCALYTLSEEINSLRAKIAGSRRKQEAKNKLMLELDAFHIDWERSRGIPHVLKKHLRKNMRKFIVFCKDEAHLNEMEPMVKKWFKEAMDDIAIKTYRVHSSEAQSDEQLEAFKSDLSKDYLHLLFAIDMLNEGLHVNEVNGVVLLRPTESPNIFYQQIGRCLKVGGNERPVIFDFVNNFKSIGTRDFLFDLEFERRHLLDRRREEGLEDRCPKFDVNDEVREITEVFGEIKFKLDNWNEMYDRLVAYHKRFGNANVPYEWEEDKSLAEWLRNQTKRNYYRKLDIEQYKKLDSLGVEWKFQPVGSLSQRWEQQYLTLCEYKKEHGDCNVTGTNKKYAILSRWVGLVRANYRKGVLGKGKIKRLLAIGFEFVPLDFDAEWEKRFSELIAYKSKHGHMDVSPAENRAFDMWIVRQRTKKRKGILTAERIQKLDSIGFPWQAADAIFDKKLVAMKKFNSEFHHINIPHNHLLYGWANNLRNRYKEGLLSDQQIQKLKIIGFDFTLNETQLARRDKRLEELQSFYKKYGHIDLTGNKDVPRLSIWLDGMRLQRKNRTLSDEFIARLDAMGMEWNKNYLDKKWNKMYDQLHTYYKRTGTSFIDRNDRENPKLKSWCTQQRTFRKEGRMLKERIVKLDKIEFIWRDYKDTAWEMKYQQLLDFKKHYGHLKPTATHKRYEKLIAWCNNTRASYREGKLAPERKKRLDAIGFMN